MYLAQKKVNGKTHYFLRESYQRGKHYFARDLMALGENPTAYLKYPGGNSYYIDTCVEDKLSSKEVFFDYDALDEIFWPFVRPDVRHAIEPFRNRTRDRSRPKRVSNREEDFIRLKVPSFDKRRAHYLKYGVMDQGPVTRMPAMLFRHLINKSRDEIEQRFLTEEGKLNSSELKTYIYVSLDLQRFFPNFLAVKMPQALDQNRVDTQFMEEICRINRTFLKTSESKNSDRLHPYLVRYAFMFFDHEYAGSFLLDDFVNDFIYRHRFHRQPPQQKSVSLDDASRVFNVKKERLENISRKQLTRLYRRKAMKLHPDVGGSQKEFVALTEAYKSILHQLKE
jgi:hypothetical protein